MMPAYSCHGELTLRVKLSFIPAITILITLKNNTELHISESILQDPA